MLRCFAICWKNAQQILLIKAYPIRCTYGSLWANEYRSSSIPSLRSKYIDWFIYKENFKHCVQVIVVVGFRRLILSKFINLRSLGFTIELLWCSKYVDLHCSSKSVIARQSNSNLTPSSAHVTGETFIGEKNCYSAPKEDPLVHQFFFFWTSTSLPLEL